MWFLEWFGCRSFRRAVVAWRLMVFQFIGFKKELLNFSGRESFGRSRSLVGLRRVVKHFDGDVWNFMCEKIKDFKLLTISSGVIIIGYNNVVNDVCVLFFFSFEIVYLFERGKNSFYLTVWKSRIRRNCQWFLISIKIYNKHK